MIKSLFWIEWIIKITLQTSKLCSYVVLLWMPLGIILITAANYGRGITNVRDFLWKWFIYLSLFYRRPTYFVSCLQRESALEILLYILNVIRTGTYVFFSCYITKRLVALYFNILHWLKTTRNIKYKRLFHKHLFKIVVI